MKKPFGTLKSKDFLQGAEANMPADIEGVPYKYLALCALDGRYQDTGSQLSPYFSEYALVKNRLKVEIFWLVYLKEQTEVIPFEVNTDSVMKIYTEFSFKSFERVKEIEAITNHDVKAVELYIDEKLKDMGMEQLVSFVHIGCTSEDINNTAYAAMIKTAIVNVWQKKAETLIEKVDALAKENAGIAMLAHTHGQPATPTTVGKEFAIFAHRLQNSLNFLQNIEFFAKFNGATGNYSAMSVAYSEEDWEKHAKCFVENYLGLKFNPLTTQIENHDYICHLADSIRHFNNIIEDLDLDKWLYISMEYFKQQAVATEVGSSTMPHKVNPIKFENSEANVELSNAVLVELSNKLPRSRMQRDLSDSSTMRNVGLAIGYSLQAISQTLSGLSKITINTDRIESDLNGRWEVLAEPIQTMLRKYGIPDAYDELKKLTRGRHVTQQDLTKFIESLSMLSKEDKSRLLTLTPEKYTGYAEKLAKR